MWDNGETILLGRRYLTAKFGHELSGHFNERPSDGSDQLNRGRTLSEGGHHQQR